MTKSEVFNELLRRYEEEKTNLIWECSCNIEQSEEMLKKEVAAWEKRYEDAECDEQWIFLFNLLSSLIFH